MTKKISNGEEKDDTTALTQEERTNALLSILKDLNAILKRSEKAGFGFLSYLLRMAILEAQAAASGTSTAPSVPVKSSCKPGKDAG